MTRGTGGGTGAGATGLRGNTATLYNPDDFCYGDDEQHPYGLSARPPCPFLSMGLVAPRGVALLFCVVFDGWTALPLYEVLVGVKGVQQAEPPPVSEARAG